MNDGLRHWLLILIGCVIGFYLPIFCGYRQGDNSSFPKVNWSRIQERRGDYSVADELADKVSVFCMILVPDIGSVDGITNVWANRCNRYQFYTANDMETLSNPTTYSTNLGQWEMTKNALQNAVQNHSIGFDWYLLAKDHTYVIVENLREFASSKNPEEAKYFGAKVKLDNNQDKFSLDVDAGVLMSKEALNKLMDGVSDCLPADENKALFALQDCLDKTGSKFDLGLDSEEKYRFIPMDPFGQFNADKFSDRAITFHTGGFDHMAAIEFSIYHWHPVHFK